MESDFSLSVNEIAVKRMIQYPTRPTLIFLHDSLGCIDLWKDFPEKLGDLTQCNVLIYDRQGHGKSCSFTNKQRNLNYLEVEADILSELINHWKLEQVVLFGHSDGGSIALVASAKYPEKIQGVITEAAHIFVEEVTVRGIKNNIGLYQSNDLKSKLEKYHGSKTDALFWAWASTWTSEEFRSWSIEKYLQKITCPTLVMQGKDDEYGTLKQVDGIINGISAYAEKWIIPDVGHTPHREKPELTIDIASQFIRDYVIGDVTKTA